MEIQVRVREIEEGRRTDGCETVGGCELFIVVKIIMDDKFDTYSP